jgi:endonuclease/exonuclease/phosphatase family metal-dependent hydrolase
LVQDANGPLVLARRGPGQVAAWTRAGATLLPADAAEVLGADHPFLPVVARDLVELCHHPNAGDLVLCGWAPAADAVSFPHENGSHGGPGPDETKAFVLTPPDVHLAAGDGGPIRPADVRRAALAVLDDTVESDPSQRRRMALPTPGALRLVTYNVHSCVGLDGALSVERVADVIAGFEPDVVALQELDVGRPRTGGVDQAEAIAGRLEMLLHFHPSLTVGEERYGDAVLSRLPMRVARAAPLPQLERRHPLESRGALWVEIAAPWGNVQLVNTHLSLHPRERRLQVDALLGPEWLGAIEPGEAILCGDFNAFAWGPACRRVTRRMRDAQVAADGHRPRATWQGGIPFGRIDHVFVDPGLEVIRVAVGDDALARVASDHLPVVVDLQR